jgi:hypothetical protein
LQAAIFYCGFYGGRYEHPFYFHTLNSAMSTFRECTLPAASPFFAVGADGKVFHPLRNKVEADKGRG